MMSPKWVFPKRNFRSHIAKITPDSQHVARTADQPMPSRRCSPRSRPGATSCCRHRRAPARPRWCRSRCSTRRGAATARILMLEPRRLATRAAATRMAALLGEAVGGTVGYRTRLDAAVSRGDPHRGRHRGPAGPSAAVRSRARRRRRRDPGRGARALAGIRPGAGAVPRPAACAAPGTAAARDVGDRRWSPASPDCWTRRRSRARAACSRSTISHAARDIPGPRDLPEAMARAVRAALAEHDGDILAFLPGMAEIRRTEAALEGCGALVLPLHGDLPPAEQDRALRPAEGRRVVLATSIAETSLTVPGVRIVVDGGWRRAPRLDPSTGLTRLTTLRISRAAAEQRAGRAGREAPGVAIRLWSTALHRGLRRLRPAGDPGGRAVGPGAGLRRLGRGAGRSAVPRPAAAGRAGRGDRAAGGARRARRRRGASPTPDGAWRRSARIRGWRR